MELPQFRRRTDGMRCVLLPSAQVEIGNDLAESDQAPRHRVEIASFLMDAELVSVAAFARFLNSARPNDDLISAWCGVATGDRRLAHFQLDRGRKGWVPLPGTDRQPMVLVSWFGASAYSLWANSHDWRTNSTASFLPTEAQWEYAARGVTPKLFPWGDAPATLERAQVGLHRSRQTYDQLLPIATVSEYLGMSPFGLHHMAGNVWQWCADWYDPEFYQKAAASTRNPVNHQPSAVRSERGGSWIGPGSLAHSSYRRGRPPAVRGRCLGFRCIGSTDDL